MLIHEDAQGGGGGEKNDRGIYFLLADEAAISCLTETKEKSPEFTNKYLANTTRESGHTLAAEYTAWGHPRT